MSLIEARHLCVRLGGTEVLHDISLAVEPGEIITVVGPNGSGKSTLLRALLGILPPAAGRVARAPGLRLGYVPQRLQIDRSMPITVRRFLSLPVRVTDAQAAGVLARALLARPQVLMLDEPTQGLDQPGEAAFYRLIEEVRAGTGCAVLMVSHDLHVVMAASDRVVCLNGHVCCEGTPQVVSSAPEYRALFGLGTHGALALYRHEHDHDHAHPHDHHHDHDHEHHGHHHA